MKQFLIFTAFVLITSCGSSKIAKKKTTENEVKPEVEIEKDIEFMINEDIAVENVEPKVVKNDTIVISEVEEEIPDSIRFIRRKPQLKFNQKVSKKEGYVHDFFSELLQRHVSEKGNVDYKNFKKSQERLLGYISILQMMYPRLDEFGREEKIAYWINAYNALTIDLILRNYPLNSIKDIKDPWDQRLWKFGDKWLNLNQIEHNILRKMDEPRIHFAIVCASYSCPKLQNEAFTASKLEEQLAKATKEFLNDSERNKISENTIQLSKIFKWFAKDFKTDGSLIDFLNKYSDIEISSNAKKSFLDYNWDLND